MHAGGVQLDSVQDALSFTSGPWGARILGRDGGVPRAS